MSETFFSAGDIYIDRVESGTRTGFVKIGSGKSMSLKTSGELKEVTSRSPDNYGQVIGSVAIPGKTELKIAHSDFDTENMAIAFLGETEDFNQGSGSYTDEVIAVRKTGKWVELGKRNFSETGFSVKDSTDTEMTKGDDYLVDYAAGLIKPLPGGDISDDENIKVSGTYAALSGVKILGATKPIINAVIRFEGVNLSNGKKCIVNIWETTLQPDSEVDFLSSDFVETSFSGSPKVVQNQKSTFEIVYI